MSLKRLSLLVLVLLLGSPAAYADALERLRALVSDTRTLSADFEQSVEDAQQKRILRSSGQVVLQRPGRFRWDYQTPYLQLIIADGTRLWIYDTELEQVTVRPLGDALGSAPSLLLSGGIDLDRNFTARVLGERDGSEWVALTPKGEESQFEEVRIGFGDDRIRDMELVDSFGQITRFRFRNVVLGPAVDPATFQFTPPPGVDVIGQ